jgi:hypothetical protein
MATEKNHPTRPSVSRRDWSIGRRHKECGRRYRFNGKKCDARGMSLISLSQTFKTNHLGLVVFDEPGQQQMKDVDLSTLLSWASTNIGRDRQMIVSTSETLARVEESLDGAAANIQPFDGFILKPQETTIVD